MNGNSSLSKFSIPFDQFQRYRNVEIIVNKLKEKHNRNLKILEIGSNEHENLKKFLPDDEIYYFDLKIPEDKKSNKYFIEGNVLKFDFSNFTDFDIVIALDVIEHIDSNSRESFIKILSEIPLLSVIISAPYFSKSIQNTEKRINELHKQFHKTELNWLLEHEQYGLPEIDFIKNHFIKYFKEISQFGHGNLDFWENMFIIHLVASRNIELIPLRETLDELYNNSYFNLDYNNKPYRYFFIGYKNSDDRIEFNFPDESNLIDGNEKINIYKSVLLHLSHKNYFNGLSNQVEEISDLWKNKYQQEKLEFEEKFKLNALEIEKKEKEFGDQINELNKSVESLRNERDLANFHLHWIQQTKGWRIVKIYYTFKKYCNEKLKQKAPKLALILNYLLSCLRDPSVFKLLYYKLKNALNNEENGKTFFERFKNVCTLKKLEKVINKQGGEYQNWINTFYKFDSGFIEAIKNKQKGLQVNPKLSVVMPVYNPPEKFLMRAIDSIIEQTYNNWEFCIADDVSTNPNIKNILEDYMRKHSNIKVVFRKENGHISAASNSALEVVEGDYIVLLDHDDELPPHALFRVVEAIQNNPECEMIYSDEDKIDEKGQRFDPYFKPDFDIDLFCSHNMFSHLGVYKKSLIDKVDGFRLGYEGSQDYDLALRCYDHVRIDQIVHIPEVLYHWRAIEGSTALGPGEKDYAEIAARKSIQSFLDRNNVEAEVLPGPARGLHKVSYKITHNEIVSIIIPTKDNIELLKKCIESILLNTIYKNYEIIIVDNNSSELTTFEYFKEIENNPLVKVLKYESPFNFSKINNFAVSKSKGEFVLFLNNDTEVINSEWLTEMVKQISRPMVGVVGAKLYYEDDTIQHGGVILGLGADRIAGSAYCNVPRNNLGYFGKASLFQQFSAVTAACMIVKKNIFNDVGGFEEDNLGVAFNDIDLCLRVRKHGYSVVYCPYAELYHYESKSRGTDLEGTNKVRFEKEKKYMANEYGKLLLEDPFYNINLSLDHSDYQLAWPVRKNENNL